MKKPIPPAEDPVRLPVNPTVAPEGVPGFHHTTDPDGKPLAAMVPDEDTAPPADTGTGDQPGNNKGDRFRTPNVPGPSEA